MKLLNSLSGTLSAGLVLAIVIVFATGDATINGNHSSIFIWAHVLVGILWIGLLYYFNFVQVPALAEAAADTGGPGGAGITKYVAPRALFWFRWGAAATWITGAAYLLVIGELHNAFTLGLMGDRPNPYAMTIGIGAWLGTIMLFNVWVLIWPNQKKVLGLVEATDEQKARGKKIAFIASRTNTLLSIPLIMSMTGAHHGFFA